MNSDFARSQMLKQQIRAWEVLDEKVLGTLELIPRENFVPKEFINFAFADMEIPLSHDESMMTPKVEGRLLQSLEINKDDLVLEVGTGSGYLTACLAALSKEVISIDIHEDFLISAEKKLLHQKIRNAKLLNKDMSLIDQKDKFDIIVFTGSLKKLPKKFTTLLRPEGKIFAVIGEDPIMQAQIITSDNNLINQNTLFETYLTPLQNQSLSKTFSL